MQRLMNIGKKSSWMLCVMLTACVFLSGCSKTRKMSEFSIEESFLRHASNIAEQYKIEKGDYPRSIEEAVALTIKADGSLGKNASAFMVKYTIADLDYEKRKEYCFFILRKKMIKNNKPMYLVSYRGGYIEWIGLDDLQEVVNILDQKLSQQGTK